MRPDVIALRNFYAAPVGRAVADCIAANIRRLWPDLGGQHLAGIGFAPPLFERLGGTAASRIALMPGPQGILAWPDAARNAAALVEDDRLPLPDGSFDRIILAHALEVADHSRELLAETWRIMAPGGRLIVVVPRRRGVWAGLERTPFASGQPFSRAQLTRLLADNFLPASRTSTALYLPPVRPFANAKLLRIVERAGRALLPGLGGVVIVEAEKQVFRPVGVRRRPSLASVRPALRPKLVPPVTPAPRLRLAQHNRKETA